VLFYALDISNQLVEPAARRLPAWACRFFVGNALDWSPTGPFDYTYSMIIPDMPDDRQAEFFRWMLRDFTKPGGRLIIGPPNENDPDDMVRHWGFTSDGYRGKSYKNRPYRCRRILWFDRPSYLGGSGALREARPGGNACLRGSYRKARNLRRRSTQRALGLRRGRRASPPQARSAGRSTPPGRGFSPPRCAGFGRRSGCRR
jgi:hypothetical protein